MKDDDDDLGWLGEAGFVFQGPLRGRRAKKARGQVPATTRGGLGGDGVGRGNGDRTGRVGEGRASAATLEKIRRVVARKPEVMVKVSGSARGRKHLREHLSYVTRNGKLEGEREDGTVVIGREGVRDMAADWWSGRGEGERKDTRDTINLVLSMPAGTDRVAVERAARLFAHAEFGGKHDFLVVHHTDTDHPHAHLTVKSLGYQGQRLDPRKGDLQAWRESFAAQLRGLGVEAEATPRRARGQMQKGTRQAVRHMDKRKASRVSRSRIEQAIRAVRLGGQESEPEPWRTAAQERLEKTRQAWRVIARALGEHGETALAAQVRQFAGGLPSAVVTRRDQLVAAVEARLAGEREKGRG